MSQYNWEEIKAKYPDDAAIIKLDKYFKIVEEAIKEKLRKVNDIEKVKDYFVDLESSISKYNIYKMLNGDGEVIYIGLTTDHKNRVRGSHLHDSGHLPDECYSELDKIHIAPVNNRDEMKIYERYLINLLEPKYNVKMKNGNNFRFKLPKLNWFDYEEYMKLF